MHESSPSLNLPNVCTVFFFSVMATLCLGDVKLINKYYYFKDHEGAKSRMTVSYYCIL